MSIRELSPSTPLLSDDECRALVSACTRDDPLPVESEVQDIVRLLIGAYPKVDLNDPDIYLRHLAAAFSEYPISMCRDVAMELPRTCKFLPRVTEVCDALSVKLARRKAIAWRAEWMQRERDRRELERARDERIAQVSPERRAELAQRLLDAAKPKT